MTVDYLFTTENIAIRWRVFSFTRRFRRTFVVAFDLQMKLRQRKRKEELDKFNAQKVAVLEGISKLSAEQARDQLVESMKEEANTKASSYIKDIMEQAKLSATKEAKKIVVETIQRTATEHAVVKLPSQRRTCPRW